MSIDNSIITIHRIPELVINSGYDWVTLGGFFITVLVFSIGTFVSVRTSNHNLKQQRVMFDENLKAQREFLLATTASQESIARGNSLKESRQAWINELRESSAKYTATAIVLRMHCLQKDPVIQLVKAVGTPGAEIVTEWSAKLASLRSKLYELRYKLELLSNPAEEPFVRLLMKIRELTAISEDEELKAVVQLCEEIKDITREILKLEWDKARQFK